MGGGEGEMVKGEVEIESERETVGADSLSCVSDEERGGR